MVFQCTDKKFTHLKDIAIVPSLLYKHGLVMPLKLLYILQVLTGGKEIITEARRKKVKKDGNTLRCQNVNSFLSPESLTHISKANVVAQWSQWSYLLFSTVQCSPRGTQKISAHCCYLFLPKENAALMNKKKNVVPVW